MPGIEIERVEKFIIEGKPTYANSWQFLSISGANGPLNPSDTMEQAQERLVEIKGMYESMGRRAWGEFRIVREVSTREVMEVTSASPDPVAATSKPVVRPTLPSRLRAKKAPKTP